MKIDTSAPRIPLDRLKHPLKRKIFVQPSEDNRDMKAESAFAEAFEREVLQDGARRFEKWLEKFVGK